MLEQRLTKNSLAECLAEKWGYSTIDAMKKDAMARFSLLENGILDQPSAKLLLINVNDNPSPSQLLAKPNSNSTHRA